MRCRALGARIAGAPAEIAADAPPARRLGGVLLAAGGVVAVGGLVGAAAEASASDDVVLGAAGAVVGFPLAVDQAAGDGDRPVLCEVLRAGLGLAAEGGGVDEQRRLVFLVVDRRAHVADAAPVAKLFEDRVAGQMADEGDYLELRRRGFCDGERGHVVAFVEQVDGLVGVEQRVAPAAVGPPAPVVGQKVVTSSVAFWVSAAGSSGLPPNWTRPMMWWRLRRVPLSSHSR